MPLERLHCLADSSAWFSPYALIFHVIMGSCPFWSGYLSLSLPLVLWSCPCFLQMAQPLPIRICFSGHWWFLCEADCFLHRMATTHTSPCQRLMTTKVALCSRYIRWHISLPRSSLTSSILKALPHEFALTHTICRAISKDLCVCVFVCLYLSTTSKPSLARETHRWEEYTARETSSSCFVQLSWPAHKQSGCLTGGLLKEDFRN